MVNDLEAPLCLSFDAPFSLRDVEDGRGDSDVGGGCVREGLLDRDESGRLLPDDSLGGDNGIEELLWSEECDDDFTGFFLFFVFGASAEQRTCNIDDHYHLHP